MKRMRIAIFLLTGLLFAEAIWQWHTPQNRVRRSFEKHREEVQQIVSALDERNTPEIDGIDVISVWRGAHRAIEFCVGVSGLVPSSTYYGFYYSQDDVPLAFQNAAVPLIAEGDGWTWKDTGDNKGYTERIEENWFYYEASF